MIQPGIRIEHYTVIEKIGQGGQAAVWSAHDERLKRTVAIKTISLNPDPEASTNPGTSPTTPDRFREEAEIIAALEHPNILPVYGFGQDEDMLYIIMRYMPSGSLKDLIKHHPLTPTQALTFLEPLAGALDMAHDQRILHRDLKSANILLDAQQHPYLADFGLSMTIGSNSSEGGGTLSFMSPEQMTGATLDQRSDLYSLGIMTFELMTGHPPRVNGQSWNLSQMINNAPLPLSDQIPQTVAAVLNTATAFHPDARYDSAMEFVTALRAVVNPETAKTTTVEVVELDPAKQAFNEAHELFSRALDRWADGAGRFRLEAGDFKYITSFYDDADAWEITLDDSMRRMMLRAALEHGHELDKWWQQVPNEADRRAVTLQTLNSDYDPARLRAMERLIMLPDSEPPAIPIRVANMIGIETNAEVRRAGITLLEKRGGTEAQSWRDHVFEPYVDGVLADVAASDRDPEVAAVAARAIARIMSKSAVDKLATLANSGKQQALEALILIREEIPALPSDVPSALRSQVFVTLSIRQLFERPLALITEYIGAALGFGIGLGTIVYTEFNDQNGLLLAQRIGTALAVGALYGALVAFGIVLAAEIPIRLRAWNRVARIGLGWLLGVMLCALAFIGFHRYFYFAPVSGWLRFLIAIIVFVAGFAISSGLTKRIWIRSLAGAVGVLFALYFSWQDGVEPLIFLDQDNSLSLILALWTAITTGALTFALFAGVNALLRRVSGSKNLT